MAAADYLTTPLTKRAFEEKLETQAQDIDQQTLLFQAQLRGFLLRHRVFRHCKNNYVIMNKQHLTLMNTRSPLDAQSTNSDVFDELRTSITNKFGNKYARNAENNQYGDKYPEWENVEAFDVGYTLGKGESTDLEAYYPEPANDSECDQSYSNTYKVTDNTVGR